MARKLPYVSYHHGDWAVAYVSHRKFHSLTIVVMAGIEFYVTAFCCKKGVKRSENK